ncbi:hypothetical protein MMC10_000733 [Thelotrema lepadinum]|nr:hypothetical protein [Thelotrema lepadinum]
MVGNWTATFASNAINVAGFRGNDTIKIGEVASAQPMGFGSVAAMTDSLWAADFSGNLGVSWLSSGSSSKGIATSFMNWVIDELAQPILSLDCDVQRGEDYSIAIGSMDVLRYEGSLTVIPIMDQTVDSWTVQVRSYWIGGQMLGADAYTDNMPLTFDTGATSCWVHGHIADDYWKQVPRAQNVESGWVWPCSDPTPDFTIQWEQAADWITIPGKVLNNGNRSMVLSYGNESKCQITFFVRAYLLTAVPAWCYGGLQIAPSINAVMGIPFFEAIYTSFNYQNATVSIANYKNEAGNASKDAPGDVSGGSSPSSYVFSFSKTSAIGHISTGSANATDTNSNSAQPTGTGTGTQIRSGSGTAVSAPSSGPSASSGQPHSSGPSAPSGSSASSGQPASSAQAKSSNPPPSAT